MRLRALRAKNVGPTREDAVDIRTEPVLRGRVGETAGLGNLDVQCLCCLAGWTDPGKTHKIKVGDEETMRDTLDFAIQVLDGNGKAMTKMPRTNAQITVVMEIEAEETDETSTEGEKVLPQSSATKIKAAIDNGRKKEDLRSTDTKDDTIPIPNSKPEHGQFFFGSTQGKKPASYFIKEWSVAGLYKVRFLVEGVKLQDEPVVVVEMVSAPPSECIIIEGMGKSWFGKKVQLKLGQEQTPESDLYLQLQVKCRRRRRHLGRRPQRP